MKKLFTTILLCFLFTAAFAQKELLSTSFEGPGFDEGWTMGVSQGINLEPQDYPATGLDPWEKWDITETTSFGYVHSGDSACILPSVHISEENVKTIKEYTKNVLMHRLQNILINDSLFLYESYKQNLLVLNYSAV